MATIVLEDRTCRQVDTLILPSPKRHFRVGLHCEHWQLRSQIGACSSRYVYYVAGPNNSQVHRLDTTTHESEILKILTFQPRGLVVKNGWISCGGEKGECVTFQIDESRDITDQPQTRDSSPDYSDVVPVHRVYEPGNAARSSERQTHRSSDRPTNNGGHARPALADASDDTTDDDTDSMPDLVAGLVSEETFEDTTAPASAPAPLPEVNATNKNLVARSKCYGTERINCITLWFPPTSIVRPYRGSYSRPVAVLANNDKHVAIVELESQDEVAKITYPDFVNRAVISPDGQLLVAICDDPYLYVHERVPKPDAHFGLFVRQDLTDFEWKPCAKIHLKSQRKDDRSDQRGSFAVCFSNTGSYLAVGTQYGTISVFNTAAFQEPGSDPLITTFLTSRPEKEVGAVRDMAFCPGPFDLLAWTEHRGRVGVADIRDNYISRQIIDLSKYDDYEQIMVAEKGSIDASNVTRGSDGVLQVALARWEDTDTNPFTAAMASRRAVRRRYADRPPVPTTGASTYTARDIHPPLGPEETMVLEALSAHRRRRDNLEDGRTAPRPSRFASVNAPATRTTTIQPDYNAGGPTSTRQATEDRAQILRQNQDLVSIHLAAARLDQTGEVAARVRAEAERIRNDTVSTGDPARDRILAQLQADIAAPHSETDRAAGILAALRTLRYPDTGTGSDTPPAGDADGAVSGRNGVERRPTMTYPYQPGSVWGTALFNRNLPGTDFGASSAAPAAAPTSATPTAPITVTTAARDGRARLIHRGPSYDALLAMGRQPRTSTSRNDHEHDDTAGLAWSEDGRVLFIGADDGLYEFHVNMFSRRIFPSIEFR